MVYTKIICELPDCAYNENGICLNDIIKLKVGNNVGYVYCKMFVSSDRIELLNQRRYINMIRKAKEDFTLSIRIVNRTNE